MFTYVTHTFNLRSLCSREATSHCKWTCDGWQVLSCQVSVKQEGPSSWPEQQTNIIEGPGATANLKWELRRGPSCSWAVPCGFLKESCGDLSLWTKTLHFNFMRSKAWAWIWSWGPHQRGLVEVAQYPCVKENPAGKQWNGEVKHIPSTSQDG